MKKKILNISFILIAVLVIAGVALSFLGDSDTVGKINLEIFVVSGDVSRVHNIETDKKYLGEALLDAGIIKGEDSQYGLFITEVDGIKADSDKEEWWCITRGGESVQEGVSNIKISDNEKYELTLMVGYGQ